MLDKIKEILLGRSDEASSFSLQGSKEGPQKRIETATAVILLEIAYADQEFSAEERARIIDILKEQFMLDDEGVEELMRISEEQRKKSIDIWHFTKIINDNYSDEEKYRVMETVWQVVFADGKLDQYEDYLVHKLSNILHVPHERMIEAKIKARPGA